MSRVLLALLAVGVLLVGGGLNTADAPLIGEHGFGKHLHRGAT
jgi:hypothetical protein